MGGGGLYPPQAVDAHKPLTGSGPGIIDQTPAIL
jgi:hypothetical protein